METLEQKIRKTALSSGVLLGVISLVLGILTYYLVVSTTGYLVFIVPIAVLILSLVIMILFSADLRKKIGGFWTFKQATTGIAIMFFVSALIGVVGKDLIFVKLVEPNMVEKMQTAVTNTTTQMLEKSGADQTKIDEQTEKMQKQFEEQKNQSVGKVIMGYGIQIILTFVFALILGAVFKREPLLKIEDAVDPFVADSVS